MDTLTIPPPINKVPDEMLSTILLEAIEPLGPELLGDRVAMSATDTVALRDMPLTRSIIRAVCRRWNNVVHSTPRAWSTLRFYRKLPNETNLIEDIFARSGTCKLDILIDIAACLITSKPGSFDFLLTMLAEHSARLRTIVLILELGRDYESEPKNLFLQLSSVLRSTTIKTVGIYSYNIFLRAKKTDNLTLDIPGLEKLVLYDSGRFKMSSFSKDTLAALRHLNLSSQALHWLPHLSTSLTLETICVFNDLFDEPRFLTGPDIYTFHSVKSIKLPSNPLILQFLSGRFRLPALTSVELQGTEGDTWDEFNTGLRWFASFIDQPLPDLTSFRLSFFTYAGSKPMTNILRLMPHVTTLGFRSCSIENILGILTADSQSAPVLMPNLTTVILHGISMASPLDWFNHKFSPFYYSRTTPDNVAELEIRTLERIEVVDEHLRDLLKHLLSKNKNGNKELIV